MVKPGNIFMDRAERTCYGSVTAMFPIYKKADFIAVILYLFHHYAYGIHGADTLLFSLQMAGDIMALNYMQ